MEFHSEEKKKEEKLTSPSTTPRPFLKRKKILNMAFIKNTNKCWQGCGKKRTVGKNVN
jgi:hypothetical protein